MTDLHRQADAIASEKSRRIVARVAIKKASDLVASWEEEEKAEKSYGRRVVLGLAFVLCFAVLVPFTVDGHAKVQTFVWSIGAGLVLAIGMIIQSRRRNSKQASIAVGGQVERRPTQ